MQTLEAVVARSANPWPLRRDRAADLAARYPHAAEMLRLYLALLPVQDRAYTGFLAEAHLEQVVDVAVDRVMPLIVDATVAAGPVRLRDGAIKVFTTADPYQLVRRWLEQEALDPFETYLARASASPLLEAAMIEEPRPSPTRGEANTGSGATGGHVTRCPQCNGLPQLSYFAVSGEALVTGPRYLVCSRCAHNWVFSRMTCANCGEATGNRLPIYQDQERFPYVRVDGCRSCHKYLLTFDLRREPGAVPVVDELAALPLDLYAIDQGLTKITPNMLGN